METLSPLAEDVPDWAQPEEVKKVLPDESKANAFAAAKKTAFIIGLTLLVFASARNSITWHFEKFWGASKDLYSEVWNEIHQGWFGGNGFLLITFGSHTMSFIYYWLNSVFFVFLDIYRPNWFMKYKIQENYTLNTADLMKAIRVAMRNQFVAFLFSFPLYFMMKLRGIEKIAAADLPSFHWVVFELCVFLLVIEIGFYYAHRIMHHRQLYKYIHKAHHEWTAPISVVAIYCHPAEHIICNILPVVMGPIIMGSHLATIWLWTCLVITSTQIQHSGYHLPFLPSPEAHDFHHSKIIGCYGVLGVLDRLHGTDRAFIKSKAYDRHIILFGLTSAKEIFPNEEVKGCVEKTKKDA